MPVCPPPVDRAPAIHPRVHRRVGAALALLFAGLAGWGVAAGCRCGTDSPELAEPPSNLVLLTVDTLRADRLGCYGYPRDTSPNIDRLAREGAVFLEAYAQRGSTWPSLASFLTSQHPVTHGVRENGIQLGPGPATLAEVLAERGFRTHAVLTNTTRQDWRGFEAVVPAEEQVQDQFAADRAIEWLQADAVEPFFLWMHLVAPHDPYEPPAEYRHFVDPEYTGQVDGGSISTTRIMLGLTEPTGEDLAQINALYDGEVAFSDAMIGRVLDALSARDSLDRSLVVVSSDHGDELLDHHDYFFHHASVYEGVLRIPLVVRHPGTVPAGVRSEAVVQSIDIAPTALELLGAAAPATFQGRSLVPLLRGGTIPAQPAFSELKDEMLSVRTDRHRYVFNPSGVQPPKVPSVQVELAGAADRADRNRVPIRVEELYDVSRDRYEQQDLLGESPAELDSLRALASGFRTDLGWSCDREVDRQILEQIDEETRKRLEAMGYVIGPVSDRPPPPEGQRPPPR